MFFGKTYREKCIEYDARDCQRHKRTITSLQNHIKELEQQLEAARREGFEAGQELDDMGGAYIVKYETYEHYAKSREGKE